MSSLHNRADPLPGTAIGLIDGTRTTAPQQVKQRIDANPAVFTRDGAARFLYLIASPTEQGSKQYFYVGQSGPVQAFPNIVPATQSILRSRDIPGPFALLEVEVNEGKGSPPPPLGENFVATSFRVLDRTQQYPLDSSQAIDEAVKRCRTKFAMIMAADPAFASVARSAFRASKSKMRKELLDAGATWVSHSERIRVECNFRLVDDEFKYGRGVLQDEDHMNASNQGIPSGRQSGVRVTVFFEASKTGNIEFAGETVPQEFTIDVPPPGGASGSLPQDSQ